MQQLAPQAYYSDETESQFTKDIFNEIDNTIRDAVGTTDPTKIIVSVENEELNTDKSTLDDKKVLDVTNPAALFDKQRQTAAADAMPDDRSAVSRGILMTSQQHSKRQAAEKQFQMEVIRSVKRALIIKRNTDMKKIQDLEIFIQRISKGSIFIVGTCVVACVAVSFGFPSFFHLLMTNGFMQLPGSDIIFMSLIEAVFPFLPSQIEIFKRSFDTLRSLDADKFKHLVEIFKAKGLTFTMLTREKITLIEPEIAMYGLEGAMKAITDLHGAMLLNIVQPEKIALITSIFAKPTWAETGLELLTQFPNAAELLRRANFLFTATSFMFNFHTTNDANMFKRELLSATANVAFNGKYSILKTTDMVLPLVSQLMGGSIRQEIPLLFGNKFVLEFTDKIAANIIAVFLNNEVTKNVSAYASDIFQINVPKKAPSAATNPADDDKTPLAVRRRALLEQGKRGEEIVKQLSSEFPEYKLLHDKDVPNYDGISKFLHDLKKFILGFFGSFVNNDYFNRFAVTCLIAAPVFIFNMPENPNDVINPVSTTPSAMWDFSIFAAFKQSFWRCTIPFITAAQLIISNIVLKPYLLKATDKIYKAGTEFIENIWTSISNLFNFIKLMAVGKTMSDNNAFLENIIIKHFFVVAGYFSFFLSAIGKIAGYFAIESIKIQTFNSLRMSSLNIVNYIRTMKIEDLYEIFSSARESLLSITDSAAYLKLLTDRVSQMITTSLINSNDKKIKFLYKKEEVGLLESTVEAIATIPVISTFSMEGAPSKWGRGPLTSERRVIIQGDSVDIVTSDLDVINEITAYQVINDYLMKCALNPSLPLTPTSWNISVYEPNTTEQQKVQELIAHYIETDADFLKNRLAAIKLTMKTEFEKVFKEELKTKLPAALFDAIMANPLLINDSLSQIISYITPATYTTILSHAIDSATSKVNNLFNDINVASVIKTHSPHVKQQYMFKETINGELKEVIISLNNDEECDIIDLRQIDNWTSAEQETNSLHWALLKPETISDSTNGSLRTTVQQFITNGERVCITPINPAVGINTSRIPNVDSNIFLLNTYYYDKLKASFSLQAIQLKNPMDPDDVNDINEIIRNSLEANTFLYLNSNNSLEIVTGIKQATAANRLRPSVLQYLKEVDESLDAAKIEASMLSHPDEMRTIGEYAEQQVQIKNNIRYLYYSTINNFAQIPAIVDILDIDKIPRLWSPSNFEEWEFTTQSPNLWREFNKICQFNEPMEYDTSILPSENLKKLLNKVQQGDAGYEKTTHLLRVIIGLFNPPTIEGGVLHHGGLHPNWISIYLEKKSEFKTDNQLTSFDLKPFSRLLLERLTLDLPGSFPLLINNLRRPTGLRNVYEFMRRINSVRKNKRDIHDREWWANFMGMFPKEDGQYMNPEDMNIYNELPRDVRTAIEAEKVAAFAKMGDNWNEASLITLRDKICGLIEKSLNGRITQYIEEKSRELALYNKTTSQILIIQRVFERHSGRTPINEDPNIIALGELTTDSKHYLELCKQFNINKPLLLLHISKLAEPGTANADTVFNAGLQRQSSAEPTRSPTAAYERPPAMARTETTGTQTPSAVQNVPSQYRLPQSGSQSGSQSTGYAQAPTAQERPPRQRLSQNEALKLNEALSERLDVAESTVTAERSMLEETLSYLYSFMGGIFSGLSGFGAPSYNSGRSGLDGPGDLTLIPPTPVTETDEARGNQLCIRHKNDYEIIGGHYKWISTTVTEPAYFPRGDCIRKSVTSLFLENIMNTLVTTITGTLFTSCQYLLPTGWAAAAVRATTGILQLDPCQLAITQLMSTLTHLTTKLTEELAKEIKRMRRSMIPSIIESDPFDPEIYFRQSTRLDEAGTSVPFTVEEKLNDLALYYISACCMALGGDIQYPELSKDLNGTGEKKVYNYGKFKMDGISETAATAATAAKIATAVPAVAASFGTFLLRVLTMADVSSFKDVILQVLNVLVGDLERSDILSIPEFGETSDIAKSGINPYQATRRILQSLVEPTSTAPGVEAVPLADLQNSLIDKIAFKLNQQYKNAFRNIFSNDGRLYTININSTVNNISVVLTDWVTQHFWNFKSYKELRDSLLEKAGINPSEYVKYEIKINNNVQNLDDKINNDRCVQINTNSIDIKIEKIPEVVIPPVLTREVILSSDFFNLFNKYLEPLPEPDINEDLEMFKRRAILGETLLVPETGEKVELNGLTINKNFFSNRDHLSEDEYQQLPATIRDKVAAAQTDVVYFEGHNCEAEAHLNAIIPKVHIVTMPIHIHTKCLPPVLKFQFPNTDPQLAGILTEHYAALDDTGHYYYLKRDKQHAYNIGLTDEQFEQKIRGVIYLGRYIWESAKSSSNMESAKYNSWNIIKIAKGGRTAVSDDLYTEFYKPTTDENMFDWIMLFTSASSHPRMEYQEPVLTGATIEQINLIKENQTDTNFNFNQFVDPKKLPPIVLYKPEFGTNPTLSAIISSYYRGPLIVNGKTYYYLKELIIPNESDIIKIINNEATANIKLISNSFRKYKLTISELVAPSFMDIKEGTWFQGVHSSMQNVGARAGRAAQTLGRVGYSALAPVGSAIAQSAVSTGKFIDQTARTAAPIIARGAIATAKAMEKGASIIAESVANAGSEIFNFLFGGSNKGNLDEPQIVAAINKGLENDTSDSNNSAIMTTLLAEYAALKNVSAPPDVSSITSGTSSIVVRGVPAAPPSSTTESSGSSIVVRGVPAAPPSSSPEQQLVTLLAEYTALVNGSPPPSSTTVSGASSIAVRGVQAAPPSSTIESSASSIAVRGVPAAPPSGSHEQLTKEQQMVALLEGYAALVDGSATPSSKASSASSIVVREVPAAPASSKAASSNSIVAVREVPAAPPSSSSEQQVATLLAEYAVLVDGSATPSSKAASSNSSVAVGGKPAAPPSSTTVSSASSIAVREVPAAPPSSSSEQQVATLLAEYAVLVDGSATPSSKAASSNSSIAVRETPAAPPSGSHEQLTKEQQMAALLAQYKSLK